MRAVRVRIWRNESGEEGFLGKELYVNPARPQAHSSPRADPTTGGTEESERKVAIKDRMNWKCRKKPCHEGKERSKIG